MAAKKKFDEGAIAADAIINRPEITEDIESPKTAEKSQSLPQEPMEIYGEDESNGKAFATSINAAHVELIGDNLGKELIDAMGQVMGSVFAGMRWAGMPRWVSTAFLAAGIAPAVAVVAIRFHKHLQQKPEKKGQGEA